MTHPNKPQHERALELAADAIYDTDVFHTPMPKCRIAAKAAITAYTQAMQTPSQPKEVGELVREIDKLLSGQANNLAHFWPTLLKCKQALTTQVTGSQNTSICSMKDLESALVDYFVLSEQDEGYTPKTWAANIINIIEAHIKPQVTGERGKSFEEFFPAPNTDYEVRVTPNVLHEKGGWLKFKADGKIGVDRPEDKTHCWLYVEKFGVFKGCKIGGGYYLEKAEKGGRWWYENNLGTDEAEIDPILFWMPIPDEFIPLPPTNTIEE